MTARSAHSMRNSVICARGLCFALLVAGILTLAIQALADQPDTPAQLKPGETVADFYSLVESHDSTVCDTFLTAINTPKIYDPNDERNIILYSPLNRPWEILFGSNRWSAPPSGTWKDHQVTRDEWVGGFSWIETLIVDLDNDGDLEHLYRFTQSKSSENYNQIVVINGPPSTADLQYLFAHFGPAGTPPRDRDTSNDILTLAKSRAVFQPSSSDFYLLDIVTIDAKNYLVAANVLRGSQNPVRAFVSAVDQQRSIEVICAFESRFRLAR